MPDLFGLARKDAENAPLAWRMRPLELDEFVGQEHILGPGKLLRRAIEADRISSLILYGPPGCGKTALAHVIAGRTKALFEPINAVTSGVADIRRVTAAADKDLSAEGSFRYYGNRRSQKTVSWLHSPAKREDKRLRTCGGETGAQYGFAPS